MSASLKDFEPQARQRLRHFESRGSGLDALKVQGQEKVQVSLEPLEILQFISGGFVPMNEMCERAGMSERQTFDRTNAVFEYFNLPIDEQVPA